MVMGRPKVDNAKLVRYSIRLDDKTEAELKAYCHNNGITKGEAIRRGIALLLNTEKK